MARFQHTAVHLRAHPGGPIRTFQVLHRGLV